MIEAELIPLIDRVLINLITTDSVLSGAEFTVPSHNDWDTDWDEILFEAVRHGLAPLVYESLSALDKAGECIPGEVLVGLEENFIASLMNYMRYVAELEQLLGVLADTSRSGTEVIVLKGAALAGMVYANPAHRPFVDIDLLIKEEDWRDIRSAFLKLGYSPKHEDYEKLPVRLVENDMLDHCLGFRKGDFSFDVKLDLFELGLRTKTLKDAWGTAVPMFPSVSHMVGATSALSLSAEYQLLHLCVHLNRHGFSRIMWCNDIALLLQNQSIDWQRVADIARKEGIQPVIYHVLLYVNRIFGELVPGDILGGFTPSRTQERIWNVLWPPKDVLSFSGGHELDLVFRKRLKAKELAVNLLLTGRVAEKACYFVRKIFPPLAFLCEKYSTGDKRRSYSYYLARRYIFQMHRLIAGLIGERRNSATNQFDE